MFFNVLLKKITNEFERLIRTVITQQNLYIADELSPQINNQIIECVNENETTQADKIVKTSEGKYFYKCCAFMFHSYFLMFLDSTTECIFQTD